MMNSQAMQKHQDRMFSKTDGNGDGAIDKAEFSEFALKLSEKTGKSLDMENIFSTYDADGDGALSKGEIGSIMKDNGPSLHSGANSALSAYGMSIDTNQISSFLDLLKSQSEDGGAGSSNATDKINTYRTKLLESFGSGANTGDISSLIKVTA